MISWLQYFFCGFFSNRKSAECEYRSLGNTFLGALLCFVLLVCGLTWGYQASFGTVYSQADAYHAFLQEEVSNLDISIADGIATGDVKINTYDAQKDGYQLIVDLRDTDALYVKFSLTCKAENKPDITYDQYLAKPAHDQQDYTVFSVNYTDEVLDIEAGYQEYYDYLESVTADPEAANYNEEIATALAELEENKGDDYYEQIYLLYVSAYYPELSLSEYGATAPTLHGYYFGLIANDVTGKLLAIFQDRCYVGFESGNRHLFYIGDFSLIDTLTLDGTAQTTDTMMLKVFRSSAQTDYLMYVVNTFGQFFLVIIVWLLLMVIVRMVAKKRNLQACDRFGSAAQLVGSYLLMSGVISAVLSFVLSFLLSQEQVYYFSVVALIATLTLRIVLFIVAQMKENAE